MSSYTVPNVIAQHPRGERIMDVYSHLLTERIVYLGTAIDPGVANTLIAQLLHLEAESQEQEINLYINCEGGDLPSMLAVYDTMQYIQAPVATTCVGQAIGVGAVLLAAGTAGKRCQVNLIVIATRKQSGDLSDISRHLALAITSAQHLSESGLCRVVGVDLAGCQLARMLANSEKRVLVVDFEDVVLE